jgi:hypothetical protein
MLPTSARIEKLGDRYPFKKGELEVLLRCHDHLLEEKGENDFVYSLAKALPYSAFFLPGDELKARVDWIEADIFPLGFQRQLHHAITSDAFVELANQGDNKSLERLIEGVANASRRGSQEALRVIYDTLCGDETSMGLIDLCVRLDLASEALAVPVLHKETLLKRLKDAGPGIERMSRHLDSFCMDEGLSIKVWVEWAETHFPGLSSSLSTFIENCIFHGHLRARTMIPYGRPELSDSSGIFETATSPSLMSLSLMNENFSGKVGMVIPAVVSDRVMFILTHMLFC